MKIDPAQPCTFTLVRSLLADLGGVERLDIHMLALNADARRSGCGRGNGKTGAGNLARAFAAAPSVEVPCLCALGGRCNALTALEIHAMPRQCSARWASGAPSAPGTPRAAAAAAVDAQRVRTRYVRACGKGGNSEARGSCMLIVVLEC